MKQADLRCRTATERNEGSPRYLYPHGQKNWPFDCPFNANGEFRQHCGEACALFEVVVDGKWAGAKCEASNIPMSFMAELITIEPAGGAK